MPGNLFENCLWISKHALVLEAKDCQPLRLE